MKKARIIFALVLTIVMTAQSAIETFAAVDLSVIKRILSGEKAQAQEPAAQDTAEQETVAEGGKALLLTEIDPDKPLVALTFDDGPTVTTEKVLEKLEEYGVTATFFVIGKQINGSASDTMKKAYDLGCEIANHSRNHNTMSSMPASEVSDEVNYTSDKIKEVTGEAPKFFRAPYLAVSSEMYDAVDLTFIQGITANDWVASTDTETRAQTVLNNVKDGTIILLHDFYGNDQTVDALDTIIPELLSKGYQFVTVSQLFEINEAEPEVHTGKIYSSVN
ncbi:MAG: polysaccharide deacetylase family protein [Clostridiales bacterium]|nr:polysaccharide deacetylase family protein [Clostridiales bacterium]